MRSKIYYFLASLYLLFLRKNIFYWYYYNIFKNIYYEKNKNILLAYVNRQIVLVNKKFNFNIQLLTIESRLSDLTIDPDAIRSKELIIRHKLSVFTKFNPFNQTTYTSGTTGTPMKMIFSFRDSQKTQAAWDVYLDTIGVKSFDERARFSGRLNAKNGDMISADLPLIKTRLYNSYNISKTTIKDYVESLNKYKPKLIEGYPSALFQLCKYILLFDLKIDFIPKAISCTAETLRIDQRQLIQEVFNCKVYNQYASSEGAPFITECKNGKYHLLLYTGLIHNVRDVEGVAVTSFRNSIIPLINYFIGDIITFKDKFLFNNEKCDCGTLMPIISNIQGRLEDTIQTKSKGNIERLDPVFKGLEGILNSQIIQRGDGKIDVFVELRTNIEKSRIVDRLQKNLFAVLGDDMIINVLVVNNIPKGVNGKFKAVICEL